MKNLMWDLFNVWYVIQSMIWQISIVVLIVILCRLFVKKVSKKACYFLWLVVAIRLLCPTTVASDFSIFNVVGENPFGGDNTKTEHVLNEVIGEEITIQEHVISESEFGAQNHTQSQYTVSDGTQSETSHTIMVPENLGDTGYTIEEGDYTTTIENNGSTASNSAYEGVAATDTNIVDDKVEFFLWLAGVCLMMLYGIGSYLRLKHKLRFATKTDEGYFESSAIASPFVFGILKPVIYMPYHLNEKERSYILLHERYHIRRRDYLVKLFAFALLAVYWFHPLVWVAFYLMSQDMEMSCDEQVLKELGLEERKEYSTLLLGFASGRRFPLPAPLSFGENNVKSRIKQILNYKKPAIKSVVAVVVVTLIVVVCCLTDANNSTEGGENQDIASEETKQDEETGRLTEEYLDELSNKLYEAKNAYIGDMPANGTLLNLLKDALEISGTNGTELQTTQEPYWINLGFDVKPDDEAMFHLATMFLALVNNASEFRWEFTDTEENIVRVYYVTSENASALLDCEDIKAYADSPKQIAELWRMIEEKREKSVAGDDRSLLVEESMWEYYAQCAGLDFTEANEWENRFIRDKLLENEADNAEYSKREITSCIYKDFDENGQKDMAVLISGFFGDEYGSRLYLYMNDSQGYYARSFMDTCLGMSIETGDIDQDGHVEFAFIGVSTGVGGAGSYCKDIFKYKDGTFWDMPVPGDYEEYNREWSSVKEMGYELEVRWGAEIDTYEIVCPSLGISKTVYSPYLRDENGELYYKPIPGEVVGGNCRGFHTIDVVEKNGKDYLIGTEVVTGEGGTVHCFADARFVMAWDEGSGDWTVVDFDVISYDYSEETIWDTMKMELEYLPTVYDEIVENHIALIDTANNTIIDAHGRLKQFVTRRMEYDYSDCGVTFVKLNENGEPIYIRIVYMDGIYYYLEDYTRLSKKPDGKDYSMETYTDEIYAVQESRTGKYIEYFYLTNEENLTLEEYQQSVLSSATPSSYDVTPVYHKELDESGASDYMRITGDILGTDMHIVLPDDYSWIQSPNYSVLKDSSMEKVLAKVEYYDGKILRDMTLLAGAANDVWANTEISVYIDDFTPEKLSIQTADMQTVELLFYVIPLDETYKMAAAVWEYNGDTYLLYGKTIAKDCSTVTEAASYIIEHFEN